MYTPSIAGKPRAEIRSWFEPMELACYDATFEPPRLRGHRAEASHAA